MDDFRFTFHYLIIAKQNTPCALNLHLLGLHNLLEFDREAREKNNTQVFSLNVEAIMI